MNTLIQKSDLLNIIDYEKQRDTYRSELIDYKKNRRFKLGPNILITFENSKRQHSKVTLSRQVNMMIIHLVIY